MLMLLAFPELVAKCDKKPSLGVKTMGSLKNHVTPSQNKNIGFLTARIKVDWAIAD